MRMLRFVVIATALAMGHTVSAQDTPSPKPLYTPEAMRLRMRQEPARTSASSRVCVLPDKSEHAVNLIVWVKGQAYRCVEVMDQNLQPVGVAWTPVSLKP